MKKTELKKLSLQDLKSLSKTNNLHGYSKLNKEDLINFIIKSGGGMENRQKLYNAFQSLPLNPSKLNYSFSKVKLYYHLYQLLTIFYSKYGQKHIKTLNNNGMEKPDYKKIIKEKIKYYLDSIISNCFYEYKTLLTKDQLKYLYDISILVEDIELQKQICSKHNKNSPEKICKSQFHITGFHIPNFHIPILHSESLQIISEENHNDIYHYIDKLKRERYIDSMQFLSDDEIEILSNILNIIFKVAPELKKNNFSQIFKVTNNKINLTTENNNSNSKYKIFRPRNNKINLDIENNK